MVAFSQVEIPNYRGIIRQRSKGFGVLAQIIVRTAIPFLRNNMVPTAKRVGAHLMEFVSQKLQRL